MLRRPKHSTIEVVAPKEEEELLAGDLNSQTGRANTNETSSTCHFYEKNRESFTIERYVSHNEKSAIDPIFNNMHVLRLSRNFT
jgi:hypothetical protein